MPHKIAVIGGDYIGPDVVAEGLKVMRAAGVDFETTEFDMGAQRWKRDGEVLSDETLEELRGHDAIYFGAVGGAPGEVPGGIIERGSSCKMRFAFDQYINQRPFLLADEDIDFIVDPGEHRGQLRRRGRVPPQGDRRTRSPPRVRSTPAWASSGASGTRSSWPRAATASTSRWCTRPTCSPSPATSGSGRSTSSPPSTPTVETNYQHIDAACIHFVTNPQQYSVIVTDNLFGDILTDLGGAVSGGIGLAASANLNPDRTAPSMFEPVHGSAPDIAGQNKANPIAAILSAAMMLEFLGDTDAAARIRRRARMHPPDRPPRSVTPSPPRLAPDRVLDCADGATRRCPSPPPRRSG